MVTLNTVSMESLRGKKQKCLFFHLDCKHNRPYSPYKGEIRAISVRLEDLWREYLLCEGCTPPGRARCGTVVRAYQQSLCSMPISAARDHKPTFRAAPTHSRAAVGYVTSLPFLKGDGHVQPSWLCKFVGAPVGQRGWLRLRMYLHRNRDGHRDGLLRRRDELEPQLVIAAGLPAGS